MAQNQSTLSTNEFLDVLKIFKFNFTPETYQKELSFSLHEKDVIEGEEKVRFDVLRQIFLDRDL